jgi:hypothetical protein
MSSDSIGAAGAHASSAGALIGSRWMNCAAPAAEQCSTAYPITMLTHRRREHRADHGMRRGKVRVGILHGPRRMSRDMSKSRFNQRGVEIWLIGSHANAAFAGW